MECLNQYIQLIIDDLCNEIAKVKANKRPLAKKIEIEFKKVIDIIEYNLYAKIITVEEGQALIKKVCKTQEELERKLFLAIN